ncbi:MAG: mechanosensitive ion channel family protein [Chloroflexaceae bacterium]|nr:mechanosensitive ion channel family protein [Chloroflexaceae bacterium]NJL33603.1 mechanosensitive ion channel family protein [Chloroflexaceae bacterium]NJO05299.1 mechanosensitive ion channel family protein [Chloroflexaceae bacterium]
MSEALQPWIVAGVILVIAVVLAPLIENLALAPLRRLSNHSNMDSIPIIQKALRGLVSEIVILAGIAIAASFAPIDPVILEVIYTILLVIAVGLAILALIRLTVGLLDLYYMRRQHAIAEELPAPSVFRNTLRVAIMLLGALAIFQIVGIPIAPFLAAFGIAGLALSLAFQGTLENLLAGLQLLLDRQIRRGNYIELENGRAGFVDDITWRTTRIRMLSNNVIIVPNSTMINSIVTNYNDPDTEISVLIDVGVSYDSDLRRVERITNEVSRSVMREVTGGIPENDPFIRYNAFGDSSINFTVILRAQQFVDQYLLKHEFIMRLHERYAQEGINIPFPIRTVYMVNANGSNGSTNGQDNNQERQQANRTP